VLQSRSCLIRRCGGCGFLFFRDRFNSSEMERLYSGYRSSGYLACRRRYEPWYTDAVNGGNLDGVTIARRQASLRSFLQSWLPVDSRHLLAVDVGGDRGQFIPPNLFSRAYLIEASAYPAWPGVSRISSIQELPCQEDLLMMFSHVLEHLPDPVSFLSRYLSEALGTACRRYVYIEVPLERFRLDSSMSSRLYGRYVRLLDHAWFLPWLMLMDALALLSRGVIGFLCPPMVLKLHEHLNFFSRQSLISLADSLGLEILALEVERQSTLLSQQGVIRLLALAKSTP
jgi:hypothetical protein